MDRAAYQAIVHRVAKESDMTQSDLALDHIAHLALFPP